MPNTIQKGSENIQELNEVQKQILRQMFDWANWDNCWHSYYHFDDILIDGRKVMRPELQKNMAELRETGLVKMYRGGLDDEGQVCGGTGFAIPDDKMKEVEELLGIKDL